jgi:GntR family transcriptional regulator, transcriptional repressor for pyruvate dehydrogenase complex
MDLLSPAVAAVFEPVQAPTTFEETVDRLGTAIRLGLLPPATRLPPERELADQLGISRSTLRQALTALTQSGHLVSQRGRTGGTFVSEEPPLAKDVPQSLEGPLRDLLDYRLAIETGAALLAAERASPAAVARMKELVAAMEGQFDFPVYRRLDILFHLALAEASESPRMVAAMTEVQGGMSDLISHIAHPPEVLTRSNAQHGRLVACLERGDAPRAVRVVYEHLEGTKHIVAGLLPKAER